MSTDPSKTLEKVKSTRLINDAKAGKLIQLKLAERDVLKITTLSPSDLSEAEFRALQNDRKKQADRARAAAKRAVSGSKTRQDYRQHVAVGSNKLSQPWLEEGCSRRTWYRKKKEMALGSSQGLEAKPKRKCSNLALGSSHSSILGYGRDGPSATRKKQALLFELAASLLLPNDLENSK